MLTPFRTFLKAEDGNVTTDWFVLTFAVLGIAMVITSTVLVSIEGVAIDATDDIDAIETGENFGT